MLVYEDLDRNLEGCCLLFLHGCPLTEILLDYHTLSSLAMLQPCKKRKGPEIPRHSFAPRETSWGNSLDKIKFIILVQIRISDKAPTTLPYYSPF